MRSHEALREVFHRMGGRIESREAGNTYEENTLRFLPNGGVARLYHRHGEDVLYLDLSVDGRKIVSAWANMNGEEKVPTVRPNPRGALFEATSAHMTLLALFVLELNKTAGFVTMSRFADEAEAIA